MRIIWLSQALVIVAGHVLAVVLAHAQALHLYRNLERAFVAGLPLAIFMILCLAWALASGSTKGRIKIRLDNLFVHTQTSLNRSSITPDKDPGAEPS